MNEQTYKENPDLVALLKKIGTVEIDPVVPDGKVQILADVKAATVMADALYEEMVRAHDARVRDAQLREGRPNPFLSGAPQDKKVQG